MTVLLIRLAAPLQSWGDSSRFVQRTTRREPTKSGIIGLIAAAQGRRRTDEIEDLVQLSYGVRTEQPGELLRDFQTAQRWQSPKRDGSVDSMPLSYRYYLSDAVFLVGLHADASLLEGIEDALRNPVFPLYLGRRSCPPDGILPIGRREGTLVEAMRKERTWHASAHVKRKERNRRVLLPFARDVVDENERGETVRDIPLSFDPERREYGWRTVVTGERIEVDNPDGTVEPTAHDGKAGGHDAFDLAKEF
ncbi:type I-E CRISPR-associated protein Cas5/CasD [Compostimonas suwonensis]|uniref:CRISPR system Cascade subunit CasD n=1 Tax=Compostimonas suwonensis TaxID=1048394 RepID=A0A2M9C3T0_9MICO|nr:type I-E CRISPR-associated protein Cas5/CasD [Compostimonas suwonensis]PJJ65185.1 CRISPR system Cascade subunit CasD [Compostimonas suwonensis]